MYGHVNGYKFIDSVKDLVGDEISKVVRSYDAYHDICSIEIYTKSDKTAYLVTHTKEDPTRYTLDIVYESGVGRRANLHKIQTGDKIMHGSGIRHDELACLLIQSIKENS